MHERERHTHTNARITSAQAKNACVRVAVAHTHIHIYIFTSEINITTYPPPPTVTAPSLLAQLVTKYLCRSPQKTTTRTRREPENSERRMPPREVACEAKEGGEARVPHSHGIGNHMNVLRFPKEPTHAAVPRRVVAALGTLPSRVYIQWPVVFLSPWHKRWTPSVSALLGFEKGLGY